MPFVPREKFVQILKLHVCPQILSSKSNEKIYIHNMVGSPYIKEPGVFLKYHGVVF